MTQVSWIAAIGSSAEPCVLVTVARVQGSTPREAGTKMVVFADRLEATIGGGNLELKAIERARRMLADVAGPAVCLERLTLGPSLGQCCGGAATLVLERIGLPRPDWVGRVADTLARGERCTLVTAAETPVDRVRAPEGETLLEDADDRWTLHDVVAPATMHVVLFGAGHVGKAIANLLGTLDCRLTWVDDRADHFPAVVPPNTRKVWSSMPPHEADSVETTPRGAFCLVMTHTHALDQDVCERLLRRGDYAYLGLIGSATKRAQFERRLAARGIPNEAFARLVCPIGIDGIRSKAPAAIAIGVVAQLLQRFDALQRFEMQDKGSST